MQYIILGALAAWTFRAARRIRLNAARYRRYAWSLGGVIWLAMGTQETILLLSGQLTHASALPLHLCSLTGVLTLPMLLGRSRFLRSAALFVGVPGAVLALLFPAVLQTPWPTLTALAFHTLHAGLVCAPALPIAAGWRPRPGDALVAGGFLLCAGGIALLVNPLTGGNYLFLAGPVAGTPLAWLGQWGLWPYRGLLACLAALMLAAEAAAVSLANRHTKGAPRSRTLR